MLKTSLWRHCLLEKEGCDTPLLDRLVTADTVYVDRAESFAPEHGLIVKFLNGAKYQVFNA